MRNAGASCVLLPRSLTLIARVTVRGSIGQIIPLHGSPAAGTCSAWLIRCLHSEHLVTDLW